MADTGKIFSGMKLEVFKEPRGILKPIEWILSILAFGTMTGVTLSISFQASCKEGNTTSTNDFHLSSSYPFVLEDVGIAGDICNRTAPNLFQGAKSSSQFFVFVGVMVFLYCLAALVLYIFCDELYRKHTKIVIIDFLVSAVIVVLWLICSSAWAQGVTDLKYYTDLSTCGYFDHVPDCSGGMCKQVQTANFGSLNASIMFGFLNMAVWVGNLWFVYKETPWHKVQETKPPTMPGQTAEGDPQRI